MTSRICISLLPDKDTQANLHSFARLHGFDVTRDYWGSPVDKFEFHCTLFCSVEPVECYRGITKLSNDVEVSSTGYSLFGMDRKIPVMLLDDPELRMATLRALAVEQLRATPTFADFRPHVSLSYNSANIQGVPLPDFPIVFNRLSVEDFIGEKKPVTERFVDFIKGLIR